jgi:hypothetical protein
MKQLMARIGQRRRLLILGAGVAGLVTIIAVGFGVSRERDGFPNETVAFVGSERITLRAFTEALATETRVYARWASSGPESYQQQPSDPPLSRFHWTLMPERVLEQQIEVTIIQREAKKRGIRIAGVDMDRPTDTSWHTVRQRVRDAIGASVPVSGPRARVHRVATSTHDEARLALLWIEQGRSLEEIAGRANERPVEGTISGDLGWVARGAETREFDEIVFSEQTSLNQWTKPFTSGNHWETVFLLQRGTGQYEAKDLEKMRDRAFREWLDSAKQSPDIRRQLSPVQRQWALDRASEGIIAAP